jgi:hypothetical protein
VLQNSRKHPECQQHCEQNAQNPAQSFIFHFYYHSFPLRCKAQKGYENPNAARSIQKGVLQYSLKSRRTTQHGKEHPVPGIQQFVASLSPTFLFVAIMAALLLLFFVYLLTNPAKCSIMK